MSMGDDYARCPECLGLFPDGDIPGPGECSHERCEYCDTIIDTDLGYCDPCNTKDGEAADGILWAGVDLNTIASNH